jgi:hypothetical protein
MTRLTTLNESASPVAYYSSYSVDRPKRARTARRARIGVTVLWALSLAMFIAVGSAWADSDQSADATPNNDPTLCAAVGGHFQGNACKKTICNRGGQASTQEVDYDGVQPDDTFPPNCGEAASLPDVECGPTSTEPGTHPNGYVCVEAPVDVCPDALNPGDQPAGTTCIVEAAPTTVTCDDDSTDPGVHDLPYTCQPDTKVDVCHTEGNGDFNSISVNQHALAEHIAHGDHLPNGDGSCATAPDESNDTPIDCAPETTLVDNQCVPDQVDPAIEQCRAMGGDWEGQCYKWVTICHATGAAGFNLLEVNAGDGDAYAAHIAHGDFLPVDGSCDIVVAPFDACPDDLNPGNQEQGTVCTVASVTPVVDACPDEALNPGIQASGTTCVVATTPAAAEAGTPAAADAFVDPAVDRAYTPALGNGAAAADPAATSGESADAVAGAGDAADAAEGANDLPFTGFSATSITLAGVLMLILGMFGHANASRTARRRMARTEA